MEGGHIVSSTNRAQLVELPVQESRGDGGHNVAVPENVHECTSIEGQPTECTGLEDMAV